MLCSDDSSEFHPPIRAESIWQALVRCPFRGFPLIFVIWVLLKSSLLGVHAVGLPFDGPVLVVLWNPWVFIGVLTVMFFCYIYKPCWYFWHMIMDAFQITFRVKIHTNNINNDWMIYIKITNIHVTSNNLDFYHSYMYTLFIFPLIL